MRYIIGILMGGILFWLIAFVAPKYSLKSLISLDSTLKLDTIIAIVSLGIAIFSLFIAVKQMQDAEEGGKKQEKVLDASRQALEQMVNHSREQEVALKASKDALERMTDISKEHLITSQAQQKALELNVKNTTEQLAILNEEYEEKKRIEALRPKLDITVYFSSEPQPKIKETMPSMRRFGIVGESYPSTKIFSEKELMKPIVLDTSNFPVLNELYDVMEENEMNAHIGLLGPTQMPMLGYHYKERSTQQRRIRMMSFIINNGEANAYNIEYELNALTPNVIIQEPYKKVLGLSTKKRSNDQLNVISTIVVPENIKSIKVNVKLSFERGEERIIPIRLLIK